MTDRTIQARRESTMWQAYRAELLAFVRRRLHDDAAAEDVVQDVLAKGYAERERLRDESRLRPWLYQITRNALIDHYRKAKAAEEVPDDLADDDAVRPADVAQELAHCLTPLIQRLPAAYREAVVLSELQGVRQKEVAGMLGLSVSGAKSRVQRGRGLLRKMLTACCDINLDARGWPMDHHCRSGCGCS